MLRKQLRIIIYKKDFSAKNWKYLYPAPLDETG
jgi:hypothetical protein